ncbi:MAG: adenosylhomocysteinase [Elusimicrobia bacterium]|nr:adenosylhomocysteinase [Elusimicrobiota bacterium]
MSSEVKSLKLAKAGFNKIEWADRGMPVVASIREELRKSKPLKGMNISACLHVTAETANLMRTLSEGGAKVALCASNPLSTQDEVAASLVKDFGIDVYAVRGVGRDAYYRHIKKALAIEPEITMDDGADLVTLIHQNGVHGERPPMGGTEETTTGVIRLKSLAASGKLRYPIIAINDADTKHFFDNRYGTGQSTVDGIIRATNLLLAGKNFVVCGYGWCGRGVASRARGMGAQVIVIEVDAVRALEAVMDGFRVLPLKEAAKIGDIFVTVTGNTTVLGKEHFALMKDGAVLANSGHFDVEIDLKTLKTMTKSVRETRPLVEEYLLKTGRRVFVLGQGRLVNLACAEGHPSSVMDMSFANQALSVVYLKQKAGALGREVIDVPKEIDKKVAALKLKTLGISIDTLSDEQEKYLNSWELGT